MNEAIVNKAIDGGWCNNVGYQFDGMDLLAREIYFQSWDGGELHNHTVRYPDALLDRTFWQALEKALGWTGKVNTPWEHLSLEGIPYWEWEWHNFIHHIAEGKSPDDFFKALLAERKDV